MVDESSPTNSPDSELSGHNADAGAEPADRQPPRRWALWMAVAALAVLFIWLAGKILLLAFAGVVLGVFFRMSAAGLSKVTRLPHGVSLIIVVAVLFSLFGLAVWRMEHRLSEQLTQLSKTVPDTVNQFTDSIEGTPWGEWILKQTEQSNGGGQPLDMGQAMSQALNVTSVLLGFVVNVVVILFIGIYTAAEPELYADGITRLFPHARRARVKLVLRDIRDSLQAWIIGKLVSMAVIGILIGVGLSILGVRAALLLALVAAVLELIPNFGPVLASIPALLVAFADGSTTVFYVACLYIGVQGIESYLVLPLIQRQAVHIPPAVLIISIVLLGFLAGGLGALVATPLLVVVMVLVKRLYQEDVLGDEVECDNW